MSHNFLNTECTHENCGKVFRSISDLIIHKEKEHVDFNPYKIQQLEDEKPECVPMSYVLRYSNPDDPSPRSVYDGDTVEIAETTANESVIDDIPSLRDICDIFNNNDNDSNNFFDCDLNDKKTNDFDCINDLRQNGKFSPDILMHLNSKVFTFDINHRKPFGCNLPGCNKRYKNVNGVKYHCKNVHNILNSPALKKSLLKFKQPSPRTKAVKKDVQGVPLLSFKPPTCGQVSDIIYRNVQRFEECEGLSAEFIYKFGALFPTSTSNVDYNNTSTQLPNLGFSYYSNLSTDLPDEMQEDFSDQGASNNGAFTVYFDKP